MKTQANYNHKESEKKWQKVWQDKAIFKFDENSSKPKFYALEMLPYPSGRIHMGHLRNYAIGDVIARFKMLSGYNVLHPMGFDSFGLPAENAALQHKIHPQDWTLENIKIMRSELQSIGLSIDWDREIITCLPEYYQHEQEIFIDFFNNGLAYQKESHVNWDPVDNTVLANEQVIDGRGWRSGALVEKRKLKQWFLKISDYSQELLDELKNLKGWDERVLTMQEKWIGRSEGLKINFALANSDRKIEVYTTRPDTLFGASFLAISANHPLALELSENNAEIRNFVNECNKSAVNEEAIEKQEKKGLKTALKALHPLDSNWQLDIYIANFVLMDYGTGALFGCPAHDERDYEFAKKYNLTIKQVVSPSPENQEVALPYLEDGVMINSQFLDGLSCNQAKEKIAEILTAQGVATSQINYRLRDWGVSRQRYWGCPIPILYLEDGSVVCVPKEDLPVKLPRDVEFNGTGNPLANHPTWKYTTYKGQKAIRETDTFDTFFESSWYFLRYISQNSDPQKNVTDRAFDKGCANKFMPVDQYVGGIEHAVLHLLYARFFTKALKKCGYLDIVEPFKNLLTQGMVCHRTFKNQKNEWVFPAEAIEIENGKFIHEKSREPLICGRSEKMSKSRKNVVEPSQIIDAYGADTARLFMLSDSPASRDLEWSESGIDGSWKYINRLWKLILSFSENQFSQNLSEDQKQIDISKIAPKNIAIRLTHKTIAWVGDEFEKMNFNRAIAKIREFSNALEKFEIKSTQDAQIMYFALNNLVILFSPIMPHLAEELWQKLGNKTLVAQSKFAQYDENLISESEVKIAVQILGKLRAIIELPKGLSPAEIEAKALKNETVQKFLDGKVVKKAIIVPDKLVNFLI